MPDLGKKMPDFPDVAKCVNDCGNPLLNTDFVKCIKGCCEKYGFDKECTVTINTEKP